jgi:hypothetical protein
VPEGKRRKDSTSRGFAATKEEPYNYNWEVFLPLRKRSSSNAMPVDRSLRVGGIHPAMGSYFPLFSFRFRE